MTYLSYLGLILLVGVAGSVISMVLDSIHPQAAKDFFRLLALGCVLSALWKALTGRYFL